MSYVTQADLQTRYGQRELIQVTDKAVPPAGIVDAAVVARACDDAAAEIDARLALRYAVPLADPVPALVLDLACRIARYKLHEDRATDKIRKDYEDATRFLGDVAAGRAAIPGLEPSSGGSGVTVAGGVAVVAPRALFTQDVLDAMP